MSKTISILEERVEKQEKKAWWSCSECGGTTCYNSPTTMRRVCASCGLEDEESLDHVVFQRKYDDGEKKRVHESAVHDGKFISIVKKTGKDCTNPAVDRICLMQKWENWRVSPINEVNTLNEMILKEMLEQIHASEKVKNRAFELFAQIKRCRDLGIMSRKTTRSRNVIFMAAIVLVVDQQCHVEPVHKNQLVDILEERSEIIKPLSKLNYFRLAIIKKFYSRKHDDSKIAHFMKKHGINRFHGKVSTLVSLLSMPHLKLEWLVVAAARFVHAYYSYPDSFTSNETIKKYMEIIAKKTRIRIDDGCGTFDGPCFIRRSNVIVFENNEFYDRVFNDEYDKIIDATRKYLDEIGKENASRVLEILNMGCISNEYLKRTNDHHALFMNAPFVKGIRSDDKIEYIAIDDIKREIEDFVNVSRRQASRANATPTAGSDKYFIGARLRGRDTIDKRSFNILTTVADGREYISQNSRNIDVDDMITFIDFVIQSHGKTVAEMQSSMENSFMLASGKRFTASRIIFLWIDFLAKGGFMKETGKKLDATVNVTGTIESIMNVINSIKRTGKVYVHWMPVSTAKRVFEIVYEGNNTPRDAHERMIEQGMIPETANAYRAYDVFKFLLDTGLVIKNKGKYEIISTVDDAFDAIESLETWDKEKIDEMLKR